MPRLRAAALASALMETSRKAQGRQGIFIYAKTSVESLATKLSSRYTVRVRGPHHYSFETMQMQEKAIEQEETLASDVYQNELNASRVAGERDSDDRDDEGNYRVFVMNEPESDEDRRALAAISTSLVTSAINDPTHTVAAFLPIGSKMAQGIPNTDCNPEPIWGGVRSLLSNLGIVTFESLDSLEAHLAH